MGEVEVGFVFSNSIVHYTVKEPERPVVCSNKPKLGLHPRLQMVRKKTPRCGPVIRLRPRATRPKESAKKFSL